MCGGGLAQMVERSLSMREVPGSIPGSSNQIFFSFLQAAMADTLSRKNVRKLHIV